MTALVGLWLVLQGGSGGWTATPARPTVGDTVWLERQVVVPAGWRVRAGRLEATEVVEALGEPSVRRGPEGWLVRYPIVAWTPGAHTLALPPIWELRPDGRADSVSGGAAGFFVQSVIPDSVLGPEPRGALAPVRLARYHDLPLAAALLVASVSLALGLRWRRRTPQEVPPPPPLPRTPRFRMRAGSSPASRKPWRRAPRSVSVWRWRGRFRKRGPRSARRNASPWSSAPGRTFRCVSSGSCWSNSTGSRLPRLTGPT